MIHRLDTDDSLGNSGVTLNDESSERRPGQSRTDDQDLLRFAECGHDICEEVHVVRDVAGAGPTGPMCSWGTSPALLIDTEWV